jgi:hypothetical protein
MAAVMDRHGVPAELPSNSACELWRKQGEGRQPTYNALVTKGVRVVCRIAHSIRLSPRRAVALCERDRRNHVVEVFAAADAKFDLAFSRSDVAATVLKRIAEQSSAYDYRI